MCNKKNILIIIAVLSIPPLLLLTKSSIGIFNDSQANSLLAYIGAIFGGLATLIAILISILNSAKMQKPILRIEDFKICKREDINYLLDLIVNVDENNNAKDKDYLAFSLCNRGKNDAFNIKIDINPFDTNTHKIEIEKDMNDIDIITYLDKAYCAVICFDIKDTISLGPQIIFDIKFTYYDYLKVEYKLNYRFVLNIYKNNEINELKIEEIKLIENK